ncbi:uncharacterized protein EI97DRAFT_472412 [Westerdykella ornata]|uniref:Uncharacterized protein n=1 Tax=Westerdykella ornata TaxID=318751 RepID=A0A6A6JXM0_WESOR|nr:uncharacterized protein EI97DRAFT_472412 [Westerdykella ornata]KAF2281157.1 hypothetical protein EI97DRAFT_472412 [Westerdykella ornata]
MVSRRNEPIAIVGTGCRFPGGASSPSALWKLLEKPRDVCSEIPSSRFSTTGFYHPDGSHHGTTNVRNAYLLQQDNRVFDAGFFNISPAEADSIDPQQRLLMETVYEALEAGGHTIENLKGSDTAVYVGTMGVDYNDTLLRDVNSLPTYFATGTNRAIISNRLSYFFDWHGPSMTIDTACSSSLIAVHQGVQALRAGESRVAVACGTNVILNPDAFVFESKMKMLSPTGRSRMWDADADGYARGEGIAAIIMKRLSDAIADGDHIECLIRETGANQDGHSSGLTVPSSEAQTALIRQTYAKAGLDFENNPNDRPQFFEAHGTGTKAGDPKEAGAIYECFGKHLTDSKPLYVGSVKTVIGHTEGAAGLAGLLKASGIIQKGIVPPNMLFNTLNPAIEKFYHGIRVPTTLQPWPQLPEGVPRRVSVNSFGFGGANAHAIIEQYMDADKQKSLCARPASTPFVFSATSEASLTAQLKAYSDFLKTNNDISPSDLSWTLQARRSQLQIRASFSAPTIEELVSKIDGKLDGVKQNAKSTIGTRSDFKDASPRILGVFTGQGAQWAAMGAQLIRSSEFVQKIVQDLEGSLSSLPESDRPQWSLKEEMLAGADTSRIAEAALSQPLCTAVQVILVDLLREAGITFAAVVGHSSGEIGAAYAAGFLSASDAIRVAYYRGVYARLAGNSATGQKGAMMAVGTSWEDAEELVNLRAFKGKLAIAAHNSPASVTLSGDENAVAHGKRVFDEEKKFARLLKVDTAYHSHHMLPCGDPYIEAMKGCGVKVNPEGGRDCSWFSSVVPSENPMGPTEELQHVYWRDNMTNAVLFTEAIKNAIASDPSLCFAIEVGPHPALKGPVTQTMADVLPTPLPYTGVLSRGGDDIQAFSEALGFIWTHLGAANVDFNSYRKAISSSAETPKLVTGLPSYQWNHGRVHWHESRLSRKNRTRKQPFNELLGVQCPDSTARDMRWSNVLKLSEISWLDGHQLQGQTVFPAAGYCAMAMEAARTWAGERPVKMFEIENLEIPKAITFEEDANAAVETLVTLSSISMPTGQPSFDGTMTATAEFVCYSCPAMGTEQDMDLMAKATVKIVCGNPSTDALLSSPLEDYNFNPVDTDVFYTTLLDLGYGYQNNFRGMHTLKRRLNQATGLITTYPYADSDPTVYLVHPTQLDVAFQASFLAFSAPGDNRLWSLHVPTAIRSIRVNPEICLSIPLSGADVPISAVLSEGDEFRASIDVFGPQGGHQAMVQIEDLMIKPFAPATAADDHILYSSTKLDVAQPDGTSCVKGVKPTAAEVELATVCERLSYYYLRSWKAELSEDDWANGQEHHASLRDYMNHVLDGVARGSAYPFIKKSWASDTAEDIKALIEKHREAIDVRLLSAVGENIPASVRGETTILEHMIADNMLDDFYKLGLGFARYNGFLAEMIKQMSHRYPHSNIIEVGAGTGGATKSILANMGNTMSSYTYTDVSPGFFEKAAEMFKPHSYSNKMTYKVLDIEKAPSAQGYKPHAYDIVVASNVLHATASMQKTLEHVRQLLKPGGYLMLLEVTDHGPARSGLIMGGLAGWWVGKNDGRRYSPTITPGEWHSALRKAGFSGVDAVTPKINVLPWPFSIIAAQAVDDRVQFLRRPLTNSSSAQSISIPSLVILGSEGLQTAQIAEEVSELLERYCDQITVLSGLPTEEEAAMIDPTSTIINLVDIETPIFKDMNDERMDGLRRVYAVARSIVWVTVSAMVNQPYHFASIAFNRAIAHEEGHISMNHFDVSEIDDNTSKAIAEHVLRQCALDELETTATSRQPLLWSREPEVFLEKGVLKIPRVISHIDQNARLNSSRRIITKTVPASAPSTSIVWGEDFKPSLVEDLLPTTGTNGQSAVTVAYSSLTALQVARNAFLYLCTGKDGVTGERVIALSELNSREALPIAVAKTNSPAPGSLISVASELLASSLISALSSNSSLLVHCSGRERFLASALQRKAADNSVKVTFSYDAGHSENVHDATWIGLHAHTPRHALRKQLKADKITHFLDLTEAGPLSVNIAQVLSPEHTRIQPFDVFRRQASLPASYDADSLTQLLQEAVATVEKTSTPEEDVHDIVVPLEQLGSASSFRPSIVAEWSTENPLQVQVRALKPERLFARNKTYLLVGLTGQIGQSLAEWMVKNGAGCVCLTSRNPKVDQRWLDSFKGSGGEVKTYAMDIMNSSDLERVVKDIRATCPPIAGIANGAMVLNDALFSKMSAEAMNKVLGPKIIGTNNLDQLFHEDKLDFFILFSSSACVVGNSGQANYAAANGYLNSLARQRRRRGLAASTLDIGRVVGIGYVETAGQAVVDQLTRFGLTALSETEIHHMFTESIQAGFSRPEDRKQIPDAVVTTGILTVREDTDARGPWLENPRFSHCIVEDGAADAGAGQDSKKNSLPVTEQLASAPNKEAALQIIEECFIAKLRVILQLADQEIDSSAPLVELGLDSLVAVEVRSWFLKELKVDIPVLKVVGGASVTDLCQRALDKLPEDLLAHIGTKEAPAKPAAKEPAAHKALHLPAQRPTVLSRTPSAYSTAPASEEGSSTPSRAGDMSTQPSSRADTPDNLSEKGKPTATFSSPELTISKPLNFLKTERLSFGQSRFWFLRQLLQDQTTFNVAFYYQVSGNLRINSLERALRAVAARHEALRTCFVADDTEADQAYQKVMATSALRLEQKLINGIEEVATEYAAFKSHIFDLSRGELMRVKLLTLTPSSHFILINYHHILMDGVSLQVFMADLEKAYIGKPLGDPPRQFPDFSAAQRLAYENGDLDQELKYWRGVFPAGEQPPILPLLPMAKASSRVPMKDFDIHQVGTRLQPDLASRVKAASKAHRSTPFNFYLAAMKVMLFSFTDAQDLTIGIADANRNEENVMGSIGFFLNLLTVRFRRQTDQTFADAVLEARSAIHSALANSHLPFDVLLQELNVTRSSSHSPFFQAFFDYRQGAQEKHPFGNCQFEVKEMHPGRTAYDITLDVTDSPTDAVIMLRVQKSLYDEAAANLLLDTYIHLLDTLSSDTTLTLDDTPLFGATQLKGVTEVGAGTHLESDWPETLPRRIDQIAAENEDKLALMDGLGNSLSYADLIKRIEAISEALQAVDVGKGSRALVFQEAAADWVCSMLAIMRLGAVYVPMDIRNPVPRLAAIAADCQPRAVLADNTTMDSTEGLSVDYAAIVNVSTVKKTPSGRVPNQSQGAEPAAILYTSGSTGTPKGIMVTHSGLRNEIEGYTKTWKLGAEQTLQQSAFTFNHSSDQIYTGLVNGGSVHIVPMSKRGDPLSITEIIRQRGITYTKATPSEYMLWMQYGGDNLRDASQWRFAFGGGETLTRNHIQEFAKLDLPQLRFFNSYGPTEISISSHKMEIDYRDENVGKEGRIPCGFSLPNYTTYIMDEQLRPVPVGMPGEICIGGAGVSLGYLNNEELTSKSFVENPVASPEYVAKGWTRLYRTNDIGRLEKDGSMVFHNRMAGDTQVKVRGLRIELADIESNIVAAAEGKLKEAVVVQRGGDAGHLVAHVVLAPTYDIQDMDSFLDQLLIRLPLPQYMIPIAAIAHEKLPLTNHSKVDRAALKAMPLPQKAAAGRDDSELSETMITLRGVWYDVLEMEDGVRPEVTSSTNFFHVGGNSLLVLRLQARIRQLFNAAIPLYELLGANTLSQMARKIEECTSLEPINWDEETQPPTVPEFLATIDTQPLPEKPSTVLVTGATGFLGQYLLPKLIENPQIRKIHCVAVRDRPADDPRQLPSSPKLESHSGDLSSPFLGLDEDKFRHLAEEVDVILHMGAARSFWDNYHALRSSNFASTKELIKLATPRRIPIHYTSTAGVLSSEETVHGAASSSARNNVPPTDGSNGYVATRWASECVLERSTETLDIPTSVYRFLPASRPQDPRHVMDEFVRFVDVLGTMPDFEGWEGRIDVAPAEDVAEWLCEAVLGRRLRPNGAQGGGTRTLFKHFESSVAVHVKGLREYLEERRGDRGFARVDGLRWIGRIKRAGFGFLFTAQDAVVGRGEGEGEVFRLLR